MLQSLLTIVAKSGTTSLFMLDVDARCLVDSLAPKKKPSNLAFALPACRKRHNAHMVVLHRNSNALSYSSDKLSRHALSSCELSVALALLKCLVETMLVHVGNLVLAFLAGTLGPLASKAGSRPS